MKIKSDLLDSLKSLIREYGKNQNPRSLELRILQSDWATEITSTEFTDFLKTNNIRFQSSAPNVHAQNLVERYVYTIKDGVRTVMLYNKAPFCYWNYALDYFIETFNNLPKMGNLKSRNEEFYGIKPDVSIAVPFYSSGYYNVTKKERELLKTKTKLINESDEKAKKCRFLGYANKFTKDDKSEAEIHLKDSYICLTGSNQILVRRDCHFRHYAEGEPSLLNDEVKDREIDTIEPIPEPNYDELLGPQITNEIELNAKNESEKETKSLTESQEIQTQTVENKTVVEIEPIKTNRKKLFEQKKNALPQRKSSRIKLFNIENNTKTTEVQNSPRIPIPVPQTLIEALSGSDKLEWLLAWQSEIKRLEERNTWSPIENDNDVYKAIKSKFCFRIVVKPDGSLKFKVRLVACGYSQI
jgi:hypothetical protein